VRLGLHYIDKACQALSLALHYCTLAAEITNALIHPDHDKTILICGDFSTYDRLVPLIADVINTRNGFTQTDPEFWQLNAVIMKLEHARSCFEHGLEKAGIIFIDDTLQRIDLPDSTIWQEERAYSSALHDDAYTIPSLVELYPDLGTRIAHTTVLYGDTLLHRLMSKTAQPSIAQSQTAENSSTTSTTTSKPCACSHSMRSISAPQENILYDEQNSQSSIPAGTAPSAVGTQNNNWCQEPPTVIPQAMQELLADAANAYFRTQIAPHEAEIVRLIHQQLNAQGVSYSYPIMINDIDMKHIMFPDWNAKKNKPTGMHSARWCPERVIAVTILPGALGTWDGIVQLNCKQKPSTFFPDSWDEKMIVNKIIEALLNLEYLEIQGDALKLWGKVNGIMIQAVLAPPGKLKTAFPPLFDYKGNICIY
jgi:hypothetical protein